MNIEKNIRSYLKKLATAPSKVSNELFEGYSFNMVYNKIPEEFQTSEMREARRVWLYLTGPEAKDFRVTYEKLQARAKHRISD